MSTSGNREWAYTEARRRARVMDDAYSIYKNRVHPDYIVRNAVAAPPDLNRWQRVATFQADGTQSFSMESVS